MAAESLHVQTDDATSPFATFPMEGDVTHKYQRVTPEEVHAPVAEEHVGLPLIGKFGCRAYLVLCAFILVHIMWIASREVVIHGLREDVDALQGEVASLVDNHRILMQAMGMHNEQHVETMNLNTHQPKRSSPSPAPFDHTDQVTLLQSPVSSVQLEKGASSQKGHPKSLMVKTSVAESKTQSGTRRMRMRMRIPLPSLSTLPSQRALTAQRRYTTMMARGRGYCPGPRYAGWDGKYLELEDCKAVCIADDTCKAILFSPRQTCNRYSSDCSSADLVYDPRHTTYVKEQILPWAALETMLQNKANAAAVYTKAEVYTKSETDEVTRNRADDVKNELNTMLNGKADANDVYPKNTMNGMLATKADIHDVHTRSSVDSMMRSKANAHDVYQKATIDEYFNNFNNNFYTKSHVDSMMRGKADASDVYVKRTVDQRFHNVYSKINVDDMLQRKADTHDVYTQTLVNSMLAAKANVDDVYMKNMVDGMFADKANVIDVYMKNVVDGMVAAKANVTDVYTKTNVDALLADKVNVGDGIGSSHLYTKDNVDELLLAKANVEDVYMKNTVDDMLATGLQGKLGVRDVPYPFRVKTRTATVSSRMSTIPQEYSTQTLLLTGWNLQIQGSSDYAEPNGNLIIGRNAVESGSLKARESLALGWRNSLGGNYNLANRHYEHWMAKNVLCHGKENECVGEHSATLGGHENWVYAEGGAAVGGRRNTVPENDAQAAVIDVVQPVRAR